MENLGGDLDTPGVDPDREFMPAGQAIGAIDELVPAGDIVRSMVADPDPVPPDHDRPDAARRRVGSHLSRT